jgi:uncharacterized protein YndB with AHSA1/START domain
MEPLELAFTVHTDPERAFRLWAAETSRWWPHGHSVSAQPGLTVTFTPQGEHTEVAIVHRGWERLGAKGPERRERNRRGWAGVIERYRLAV